MKYFIYHIPGKKIGVTRNLDKRVTQQQGYAEGEYEVLFVSDDIDQISKLEIELQKSYGYPVDSTEYKNLFKSNAMKINVTDQTTTFPVRIMELKEYLGTMMGVSWVTPQGDRYTLSGRNAEWILDNAMKSMYTEDRCYIYNEAFKKYEEGMFATVEHTEELVSKFELIRKWAETRGIYESGDTKTQYVKLMEESGELAQAILKNDNVEFVDAIGDMVVVLTNLAHLGGYKIEECIDAAYGQIANRKGKMQNGTFVKEEAFSNYLKSKAQTL
jgi:NTP pyrophosphatase (non-canonical NTP hydrolase)